MHVFITFSNKATLYSIKIEMKWKCLHAFTAKISRGELNVPRRSVSIIFHSSTCVMRCARPASAFLDKAPGYKADAAIFSESFLSWEGEF